MCTLSEKTSPGKSEESFSKFHHFSPTKISPEKVFLKKVILMDWKTRQILWRWVFVDLLKTEKFAKVNASEN